MRLARQGHASGQFSSVQVFDETFLRETDSSVQKLLTEIRQMHPRGYGLWGWKPVLANHALGHLPPDAQVLYLDAGFTLNLRVEAMARIREYIDIVGEFETLFFRQPFIEQSWTAASVLDDLGLSAPDRLAGQVLGGVWQLKNTASTRDFMALWQTVALQNSAEHLVGGQGSTIPGFCEHRHDQSVLSCLVKSAGKFQIDDETYFAPDWELFGSAFPYWATRLATGNARDYEYSIQKRLKRAILARINSRKPG